MRPRHRHLAIAAGMSASIAAEVFVGFRSAENAPPDVRIWIAVATALAVVVTGGTSLLLFRLSVRQGRLEADKLSALELERSARLVEVGRLAAGVAHEIHNPLQGVNGYLALLEREGSEPERLRAHVAAIRGALQRIERLTRDLLDFAQPKPDRRAALAPYDLFRGFLRALEVDPRFADVSRKSEVDPGVPSVHADPAALERILLNLALNAREAMGGRGTLVLRARRVEPDRLEIEVADTGPGVDPKVAPQLFQPFASGRGSTGLGLWICANLARAHGGSIRHEAGFSPGAKEGSRFVVTLPPFRP